jgi:hypothetical protein
MILIITNKTDVHPNTVIKYLGDKNASVFRLNTEAFLTDYKIHWENINGVIDVFIENIHNRKSIKGSEITSVWERRPEKAADCNIEDQEMRSFCLGEATGFLQNLQHYLSDKFWLGHPLFDRLSDSKILQIKIANMIGLKTPNAIISNNYEMSLPFFNEHSYFAQKAIEASSFDYKGTDEYSVFWTKKIDSNYMLKFPRENFELTYNNIQEYIPKKFELRVTVVVDKVFTCKLETQHLEDDKGKIDFRQGYDYGLKYEVYQLPIDMEIKCIEYLKKMHLNFGCFDFLVTENDEYVFLECNSNGQWLWIEQETSLPISKAIGDSLINGYLKRW